MNKDQIDIAEGRTGAFLDGAYSPAILAGLFNMSPANIYQLVQRGILSKGCTYREAIKNYIEYWKGKSKGSGSIAEIATVRKAELDRVRTISAWYSVKKERQELVDKDNFLEQIEPIFHTLRSELIAITRKFPETRGSVDKILNNLARQGQIMTEEAKEQLLNYVEGEVQVMADMEEGVIDVPVGEEDYSGGKDGTL